jgi:hypothetical protein
MEAYLDKILQPEVLATLFAVFVFARATTGGKKKENSPCPAYAGRDRRRDQKGHPLKVA